MIQSFPFSLSSAAAVSRATKKSDLELPLLIWQKLLSSKLNHEGVFSLLVEVRLQRFFPSFSTFFSISKTLIGPTTAALMDRLGLNNDK